MKTKLVFTIINKYIFVLNLLKYVYCIIYELILVCTMYKFFQKMASFNPLTMILNQKPLDGNNFEDWKTNLYIVLDYEKIKFVLNTPKPAIPEAGANDITKTEHATWENANTSLRCYIFASVVGHLRQQITPLDSGVEMLQTLEGMFTKSTASERQAVVTNLINTHCKTREIPISGIRAKS